jgi:putative transposase
MKLAKRHNKKTNIKIDFNHKLSHYLVKNRDLIVLEDLKIKNRSKSAKGTMEEHGVNVAQKSGLNRAILENNWGQLKDMISYKTKLYGKHLVLVSPQFISQKCSNPSCNHIVKENRNGKEFHCLKCGLKLDADLNAAINIKEAGLALLACRDISLKSSMKQELETKLKV